MYKHCVFPSLLYSLLQYLSQCQGYRNADGPRIWTASRLVYDQNKTGLNSEAGNLRLCF